MLEFSVLGPITARRDGEVLAIAGPRQRALPALLLAEPDRTVTRDRAIAHLWSGARLPADPTNALQQSVAKLRRALGARRDAGDDGPILTRERGYELVLGAHRLDARSFERLVADARRAAPGDPARCADLYRAAAALWRGEPFAEHADTEQLAPEAARLAELRLEAMEERAEAELALGNAKAVASELEALVRRHPFREGLWEHLMLALYRSGRQRDALEAYRRARRSLHDELGIEPGPGLRRLERRILRQDPALRQARPAVGARGSWSVHPLLDAAASFAASAPGSSSPAHATLLTAIAEAANSDAGTADLERWTRTLEAVDARITESLAWALSEAPGLGLRLASAACLWWDWRGVRDEDVAALQALVGGAADEGSAVAEGLTWLAFFRHQAGDARGAAQDVERATLIAQAAGDPVREGGAAAIESILLRAHAPRRAVRRARIAVDLLGVHGTGRERGYALVCHALALLAADDPAGAAVPAEEAALAYAEEGDLRGQAWVAGVRSSIAVRTGRDDEAARLRAEAVAFADAMGDEATRRWLDPERGRDT